MTFEKIRTDDPNEPYQHPLKYYAKEIRTATEVIRGYNLDLTEGMDGWHAMKGLDEIADNLELLAAKDSQ